MKAHRVMALKAERRIPAIGRHFNNLRLVFSCPAFSRWQNLKREMQVGKIREIDTWYHIQYHPFMTIDDAIGELESHETNTRFQRLVTICTTFFGTPRIEGSHHIFKTPWSGNPRINLQALKGKAKPYQVRQVVKALQRLKDEGG